MRIHPKIAIRAASLAILALAANAWSAPDYTPRVTRPTHESWSDGPTLYLKHQVLNAKPQVVPQRYRQARLRLKALEWGQRSTITTVEDLRNFLGGHQGKPGAIAELKGRLLTPKPVAIVNPKLVKAAVTSKDRLNTLLSRSGIDAGGQTMLAEMMVWRGLAYNSSTLAHGSFGPEDAGNEELQLKARLGLERAIARSFNLGDRLQKVTARRDPRATLSWNDIKELQAEAVREFPEKEPGKVREVNFTWPVNSFGVNWQNLHGPDGHVAKLEKRLAKTAPRGTGDYALARNPVGFMARTIYWLHNVHPFRDGNGRTEVLLAWSMARGAGYPVPFEFDSVAGDFKLAATKWGGAPSDLQSFLAKGALGAERFVRKLLPVLDGGKIVSTHSDHGAVASVVAARSGREKSLVVMFPVTFAKTMDPELLSEQSKNRLVLTGDRFDPKGVRIQIAVDGKHNAWQTVEPAAVSSWTQRYPWWTTVEPIYKVKLPASASFVNFRVVDAGGRPISGIDFYMNLREYRNLGSRLPGGAQ